MGAAKLLCFPGCSFCFLALGSVGTSCSLPGLGSPPHSGLAHLFAHPVLASVFWLQHDSRLSLCGAGFSPTLFCQGRRCPWSVAPVSALGFGTEGEVVAML